MNKCYVCQHGYQDLTEEEDMLKYPFQCVHVFLPNGECDCYMNINQNANMWQQDTTKYREFCKYYKIQPKMRLLRMIRHGKSFFNIVRKKP